MMGKTIKRGLLALLLSAAVSAAPAAARAGWIVEWSNTAKNPAGEQLSAEPATMYIDKERVRIEQPTLTTIMDYDKGNFTILNPDKRFFWSGKVKDYVREAAQNRADTMRRGAAPGAALNYGLRKVDEASLPRIVIKKTDETREIAGHQTTRYEISSNRELFQEIWLAEDINMKSDLDPTKFLDYQREMSGGMLGKSADAFNALHRSQEYADLLTKGFVLQSIVHHGAGTFKKEATAIRTSNVAESEFAAPETYRRVRLKEVFPKAEEEQGSSGQR